MVTVFNESAYMNESFISDKNLLKLVLIFEIIITILIAIGILPREYSFAATGTILVFIAGASIVDSLILAILSIPFYLALPITQSFDTMANWRIIILVLFLKFIVKKYITSASSGKYYLSSIKIFKIENIRQFVFNKNVRLEILGLFFMAISFFSLIGADNISAGVKKILFLLNIFLFFIIVKNAVHDKEIFLRILKTSVLAGIFSLIVGYAQIFSILFFSLANFWEFWTKNVIAALYGASLSSLLSYSNTWFSYYPGDIPPTLRMFSVFPDSHSFALFNIILIPFILTLALCYKNIKNVRKLRFTYSLLMLALLAIIFSGSRGAWASALIPLGIIAFIKIFHINLYFTFKQTLNQKIVIGLKNLTTNLKSKIKNLIIYLAGAKSGIIASTIILFFLLFPVSSIILEQTQKAEWQRLNSQGNFSSFAMYKRLKSIVDLDEISNKGRIEIWRDTFISIKKHPIFGVGIGNFTSVIGKNISAAKKGASAHNLFLDIFAETGILGLIIFFVIFYEILKTAFLIFKNSIDELYKFFALSFGIYLFWILGYALFDVVLFNDKVLLLFMLSTGMLYGIKNFNLNTELE